MPVFYGYPVITNMYMLCTLHMKYIDDFRQVYTSVPRNNVYSIRQYAEMVLRICAFFIAKNIAIPLSKYLHQKQIVNLGMYCV